MARDASYLDRVYRERRHALELLAALAFGTADAERIKEEARAWLALKGCYGGSAVQIDDLELGR